MEHGKSVDLVRYLEVTLYIGFYQLLL